MINTSDNLILGLASDTPSVVYATIDQIEATNPELLKTHIVPLLLNNDLGIRTRAVRAMCKWDKNEAVRFLQAMMFSQNQQEREAALANSFFYPFKQIVPLLLKFITIENEASLVQKAGIIFMSNPDKDLAYWLFEAKIATSGLRSDLISSIMQGVLTSLYQAKLVDDAPAVLLKKFEAVYNNKRQKLFIEQCSALLKNSDEETKRKAVIKLCDFAWREDKDALRAINEFLAEETDEAFKSKIRLYLAFGTTKLDSSSLLNVKDPEHRQKLYTAMCQESYSEIIRHLLPEFYNLDKSEKLIIIGFIKQFGSKEEANYLAKCLESDDTELLSASIDCFASLDPESLHSKLTSLLKNDSDEVKLAAIRCYALYDKSSALSQLSQMIISTSAQQRRSAIICLGYFDFASVGDLLITTLRKETEAQNILQIHSALLSNATEDVFYQVYFDSKSCRNEQKFGYNAIVKKIASSLVTKGIFDSVEEALSKAEANWQEEEAIAIQREEYKLEKIESMRNEKLREEANAERLSLFKFAFIAHTIGFALTVIIFFVTR